MESVSNVSRSQQECPTKEKSTFLHYYKTILEKVSFDRQLFNKEYHKAVNTLSQEERAALNGWIRAKRFDAKA